MNNFADLRLKEDVYWNALQYNKKTSMDKGSRTYIFVEVMEEKNEKVLFLENGLTDFDEQNMCCKQ